jgi:Ca-activated chloride channel family protein
MNRDRSLLASFIVATLIVGLSVVTAYVLVSRYADLIRMSFGYPQLLLAYFALPALTVVSIFAARRRRHILSQLGRLPALAALTARRAPWQRLRSLCWFLGMMALLLGLAGLRWGRESEPTSAPGRDLVVLLDLSRSMLADDVSPSRQERAKQALRELIASLKIRGGNRVALVAFAARADLICPLTHDYDHFLEKLDELDAALPPAELRPKFEGERPSFSGTRIGAGLWAAKEAHDQRPERAGLQDILLLSDGDDPKDGRESERGEPHEEWNKPVKEIQKAGVHVYTVGIGDKDKGGKIPTDNGPQLDSREEPVITRLKEQPLKSIAQQTKGTYTLAGTEPPRLAELFQRTIDTGRKETLEDALPMYRQRYSWFFGAALLLLSAELMIGRTQKRQKPPAAASKKKKSIPAPALQAVGSGGL